MRRFNRWFDSKDGNCESKGRNGLIKTSGIEVMASEYGVMVSPITSRGFASEACWVEMNHATLTAIAKWWLEQPEAQNG
jgi:hypothetical protein